MKRTMVFLTLSLLVTEAWAGTLRDNFEDGDLDGWKFKAFGGRKQKGQCAARNGVMVCASKGEKGFTIGAYIGDWARSHRWKNYEFECQFMFPKTLLPNLPAIGFVVRNVELVGNLSFQVSPAVRNLIGCYRFVANKGKWMHLENFVTQAGKWYTVRIVVLEKSYKMFLDEKLICAFSSDLPDKGGIALAAGNCEVHFDNIVITGAKIPDLDMKNVLAVSPRTKLTTTWGQIRAF